MSQFKRNLAIVIGINNYQDGIAPLSTAVNDAQKIAQILQQEHDYQVWGLLDEHASLQKCLRLLEDFLPQNVQESDRLIFYFAGHGIALNSDSGLEGFLIPQDAKLGDTSTYFPMVQLQKALNNLPCRHFLCILDCCFAGAFRWSSTRHLLNVPEVIHKERYDRFIETAAWQVITSTSHNQLATDLLNLQDDRGETDAHHSPFAAALIEALQGKADSSPTAKDGNPPGDGVITATELYLYLRDRVEIATEDNGQKQTPGLYPLQKHDRGEYIFLTPGHELNLPDAPSLDESQNPYRGLESFQEEHSKLFFGRQKLTQKLYKFCQQNPLTVVLGASGTGKSSLIKAGLIPWLQQLKASKESWIILSPMRPGEYPFKALNKILTEHQSSGSSILSLSDREKRIILSGKLEYILSTNHRSKLLLVVDQTEELITLCRDQAESRYFLTLLAEWLEEYPTQIRIILTLRSDFEPQIRELILKPYWQKARFIVPAMTREELKEAIEKPALARVIYFEPYSLIDRLIDEVMQMPGALPLLSFTLSELYLKYLQKCRLGIRDKRAITQKDYEEIGGVAQSLTQRANYEYEQLVKHDKAYAQTICNVMLRMIAVNGGEIARRQVLSSELEYPEPENARVKQVIKSFSTARLLVEGQDIESNSYVEPAHDALVRGWQKLLIWKKKEEEHLLLQRHLSAAAKEWRALQGTKIKFPSQESCKYLWHNNPYLNILQEKLTTSRYWLNQIESEFVERSLQKKKKNFWLSLALKIVVSLIVLSAILLFGKRIQDQLLQSTLIVDILNEFQPEDVLNLSRNISKTEMPGNIQQVDRDWHPLAKKEGKEENEYIYAIYRKYGKGKVLAIGHEGIISEGRDTQKGFLLIILNLLHGIGDKSKILISTEHCEHVTKQGGWDNKKIAIEKLKAWKYNEIEEIPKISSDKLKSENILIIGNAWGNFGKEEIKYIKSFVSKGGQLLLIGTGWSWQESSQDQNLRKNFKKLDDCHKNNQMKGQKIDDISTYPMNRILEVFGARFEKDKI